MPWTMHDKEYANVVAMSAPERYRYMLGKLGDWREVYSLRGADGWVVVGDDNGREGVPIWPHPRYAEACATKGWAECKASLITLDEWLDKWLPGMSCDDRFVAAFMLPGDHTRGIAVEPQAHREHLLKELEKYGE